MSDSQGRGEVVFDATQIGKIFKTERVRRGLTQVKLAQQTGLLQKTISTAENGGGCQLRTLLAIATHLEMEFTLGKRRAESISFSER